MDTRRKDKYQKSIGKRNQKRAKPMDENRKFKIQIWQQTIQQSNKYYSDVPESTLISVDEYEIELPIKNDRVAIIEVLNIDSFNMAINYVQQNLNPCVLNMASEFKPGGGVRSGSSAQEEELFRRSNALLTHPEEWYNLGNFNIIYSPEITIFRDDISNNYEFLDDPIECSMLAVPAVRHPRINKHGKYNDDDEYLMKLKIEAIFKVAIQQGNDSLVLGALGCGAFGNPPELVAQIFKEYLDIYKYYFKKIGFAILVVKESDQQNLDIFKNIILN